MEMHILLYKKKKNYLQTLFNKRGKRVRKYSLLRRKCCNVNKTEITLWKQKLKRIKKKLIK